MRGSSYGLGILCTFVGIAAMAVGACSGGGEAPQCVPQCAERECGDDGCGGDCGACPQVAPYCVQNQCAVTCEPSCNGRECGDDGCGGSCGVCLTAGSACGDDGLCAAPRQQDTGPVATQGPTTPIVVRLFLPSASADPMAGVGRLVFRFQFSDGTDESTATQPYVFGQLDYDEALPIGMQSAPTRMVVEGWSVRADGDFGYLLSVGRYPLTPGIAAGSVLTTKMARINQTTQLSSVPDDIPQALMTGRIGHTLTHTAEGDTLIVGGSAPEPGTAWWHGESGAASLDTVAVIDGSTWGVSVSSSLAVPRAWHTAIEVPSGDVFVAGGWAPSAQSGALCAVGAGATNGAICAVEWYAPGDGFQLLQQPLAKARAGHTATLVDDTPTVLFVGGDADGEGTWELWDPAQGSRGAQALPDATPRRFHAAVAAPVLDDNGVAQEAVVIFGGESDTEPLDSGLFYVVESELMLPHPLPLPKGARTQLTGTYVAAQGFIYFIAGYTEADRSGSSTAIDVYDARAATWQSPFVAGLETFNLNAARGGHSASLVEGTRVVVLGGSDGAQVLDRTEVIYEYAADDGSLAVIDVASSCHTEGCVARVAPMASRRVGHRAVVDQWGDVLVVGGCADVDATSMVQTLNLFTPQ